MSESEVASYVLAYLLRQKYSATTQAFLQECTSLPTKTLLVLPETPLQTIITEYKVRKDTGMLLDTLGPNSAWDALWEKMEQTLKQLRSLSDVLLSQQGNKASSGHSNRRTRTKGKTNVKVPPPPSPASPLPPPPSSPPPTSTLPHFMVQVSPRRKQTAPRHMAVSSEEVVEAAEGPSVSPPTLPPSLDMQQVLDTFLGSDNLPEKLADIINQCVGDVSGENKGGLSAAVDNILNLTCTEPAFEGLLPVPLDQDPTHHPLHPSSSQSSHPLPPHSSGQVGPLQDSPQPVGVTQQRVGDREHGDEGTEVPSKRPRLTESDPIPSSSTRFPSEMDIDRFLDQLHKQ